MRRAFTSQLDDINLNRNPPLTENYLTRRLQWDLDDFFGDDPFLHYNIKLGSQIIFTQPIEEI